MEEVEEQEVSSKIAPPVDLRQLLISCAISDNKSDDFERYIRMAKDAVSLRGDPIQRLGCYVVEGLLARKGTYIYKSLESKYLFSIMQTHYQISTTLQFGYLAANETIAEVMRNEDHIHIIDFQIGQGLQWISLLQTLAARPGGPPHVRITGIDDPVSQFARGGVGLEAVGARILAAIPMEDYIPIEFNGVPDIAQNVTRGMLNVRPGEALAVSFPLLLQQVPDGSLDGNNLRGQLLTMVKSLSPKVVTLVEQDLNTNRIPFVHRIVSMWRCIVGAGKSPALLLGMGRHRLLNHQLFPKWKTILTETGFRQYPLSSNAYSEILSKLSFNSGTLYASEPKWGFALGLEGQVSDIVFCLAMLIGEDRTSINPHGTKEIIKLDKPKGYVIVDFLEKLEGLMGKEFSCTELLAKAGEIVAERAREEAEVLRDKGEVEERMMAELFRVLRQMEMDLAMVKAAVQEATLGERLEQTKASCRQAILVDLPSEFL
uniref:Uncharacterized protein n=1 Tax=Fagus sylvatica TaxID=28930 RepID=A0A2N9H5T1_FAGSY